MPKTLDEHYGYLSDAAKREAYESAIRRLVRPEHVVIDLGCGTGLLGLMALRAGARKVFFVEEDAVIEVARQAVANAGLSDRAGFLRGNSYELVLPEKADVVVCDHVGYFGFDYGILGLLADARRRLLKPDGIVVPAALELFIAPVASAACRDLVGMWRDGSVPQDFHWLGRAAANSKHAVTLDETELVAGPVALATLELGEDTPHYLSFTSEFQCGKDQEIDGIAGWFNCHLCDEVQMTNAPGATPRLERPQAYLPFDAPVAVKSGESMTLTLMIRHEDGIIGWVLENQRSGERFAQTTFNGLLLDDSALHRSQSGRTARLNQRGRARQLVLAYCDGKRTVGEIENLVLEQHPDLFASPQAISNFVRSVLQWETA